MQDTAGAGQPGPFASGAGLWRRTTEMQETDLVKGQKQFEALFRAKLDPV